MRPKEIFADAVSASNSSILTGDLAKLLRQTAWIPDRKDYSNSSVMKAIL